MNNKEFLEQRACDMTVGELLKAVELKIRGKAMGKESEEEQEEEITEDPLLNTVSLE